MSIASCSIRLSPGRVFTVRAGPASGPLRAGRIRDPAALVRDIESLTFATGIPERVDRLGSDLPVLFRILNPIVIVAFPMSWLLR